MHQWDHLLVGGTWTAPAGSDVIAVVSPHDGSPVGRTPLATPQDVDRAVAAARTAFDAGPWPRLAPADRIEVLERVATRYAERVPALNALITAEMGSPRWFSELGQAGGALALMQLAIEHARTIGWEERRGPSLVRREPVGVVAAITPWNVPQVVIVPKLFPALLAGCCVIVKPSPEAPLDAMVLAEVLVEAGLPEGVVSVLPGDGVAGRHLVSHPGVDKVAFTGSSEVGRWIGAECGRTLTRCSLELGGKSAAIVLEDANLDRTVAGLKFASLLNNGEACVAQTRVLAPRSRYAEVVEALAAMVDALPVGDPSDLGTYIGPLVSARHRERVHGYLELGVAEGATVAAGGPGPVPGLEGGQYVRPTVFSDVTPTMRVGREEIFGPVLSVLAYDDEQDAVRLANDSDYGLAGSVWTRDREHGLQVARQVRTGTFGINGYAPDVAVPFGGFKASGIGREYGPEGFDQYVELKSVYGVPG
jgi:betaine-aldehyde dehydrogenase